MSNNQKGLAAIEMMLIAPILLSLCYVILRIADSAALWELRIIESRNSAYRAEIYNNGSVDFIDMALQNYDRTISVLPLLDDKQGREYGSSRVKRYATEESHNTFKDLVDKPRQANLNRYMRQNAIRDLTSTLDNTQKISIDNTAGIGFSYYYSPVGRLKNLYLEYQEDNILPVDNVVREKHYADFANSVDISSNNTLCTGYDDEMVAFLQPGKLYSTTFPRNSSKCAIRPFINIPDL